MVCKSGLAIKMIGESLTDSQARTLVYNTLNEYGMPELAEEFRRETSNLDHDHLYRTVMDYVQVSNRTGWIPVTKEAPIGPGTEYFLIEDDGSIFRVVRTSTTLSFDLYNGPNDRWVPDPRLTRFFDGSDIFWHRISELEAGEIIEESRAKYDKFNLQREN
jgi:hypothetical protein